MTAASAVARGRVAAERLMVDEGTVTRRGSGDPVFNETTGEYEDPARTTVYAGRSRLQVRGMGSSTGTEAAGGEYVVQQTVLQLPAVEAAEVRIGDQYTHTVSPHNPALVGRVYDIARPVSDKTHATKREFLVTEAGAVT